jgi:hypothetical protein
MALSVGEDMFRKWYSFEMLNIMVAIFVGETQAWVPELVERAKKLRISGGFESGTDL